MGHIFGVWGIEVYAKMSRIHEEKHLVSGLLFFYASPTGWQIPFSTAGRLANKKTKQ